MVTLQFRKKVTVLTDPLRRVYDGVPFSSKEVWTEWADICSYRDAKTAEDSVASFKQINPDREYRVVPS